MHPSAFVFMQSLPQTNGKIDRRALPLPERTRPNLDQSYTPAKNDTEQQLAAIWEQVLDLRPIGVHDSFFDLGGHSLAATRVVSQVIKIFQLELPLRSLF
jgi:Phosphopantetheine attachment site